MAFVSVNSSLQTACLERKLEHLLSRERRLLKIIVFVILSFVLCWTPFWMVYVLTPFCDGEKEWCRYIANARYA